MGEGESYGAAKSELPNRSCYLREKKNVGRVFEVNEVVSSLKEFAFEINGVSKTTTVFQI